MCGNRFLSRILLRSGGVSVLVLVMVAWQGAVAIGAGSGLTKALVRVSDLPPAQHAVSAPWNVHRSFSRYESVMSTSIGGGYACYPPESMAHLGWKEGLVEGVANGSQMEWGLCLYSLSSPEEARAAFVVLSRQDRAAVKGHTAARLRLSSPIGDQAYGYVYSPMLILRQYDIVFRVGTAVAELHWDAKGDGDPYSVTRFVKLAEVTALRLAQ